MKKRILAVCCMLTMVGALVAGCGTTTDDAANGTKKTKEETTKEVTLKRGTTEDREYKNSGFGVSFSLPENTEFCSDEQVINMLGADTDILDENGVYDADTMLDTMDGILYDCVVLLSDGQSNVLTAYEDLEKSGNGAKTEKEYAEKLVADMEDMEAMGYKTDGVTSETINGTEYTTVKCDVKGVYQKYYMKKDGKYMILFMSTFTSEMEQEEAEFMQGVTCK